MAVNMVSKVMARKDTNGNLDVPERYLPFLYSDGSVNNQALQALGTEGYREMRAEMLGGGENSVLVDRPPVTDEGTGWMQEAHKLVLRAARREVQRVWKRTVGSEWNSRSEAKESQTPLVRGDAPGVQWTGTAWVDASGRPVRAISAEDAAFLESMGRTLPGGESVEIGDTFTAADLRRVGDSLRLALAKNTATSITDNTADAKMAQIVTTEAREFLPDEVLTGAEILDDIKMLQGLAYDQYVIESESPWDLPEDTKRLIRYCYQKAVNLGYIGASDYTRSGLDRIYGTLNMEPPDLTSVGQMENTITFDGTDIRDHIEVVDGDTVNVLMDGGGVIAVRLQGVNAPDRGQYMWSESTQDLQRIFDTAETITLGVYKPATYGTYMTSDPTSGRQRAKLFLIADGVPIIDAGAYTVGAPSGATSGMWGYRPPIWGIYFDGLPAERQGQVG
jgi:hypothetical protein